MKTAARTLRAVAPALYALLLTGCPPVNMGLPVDKAALEQRLGARVPALLGQVLDGPGAEEYEKYIERSPVARIIEATGDLSEEHLRKCSDDFSYGGLVGNPGANRGKVIFDYMVVGEIRDLDFRAGGSRLKLLVGGTPQGDFYAYVYPVKRGRGHLYGGDVVWCSGVFVKVFSFVDGTGERRRVPLFAGPPPTYTGDWYPYGALVREPGLEDFFPLDVEEGPPPPCLFATMDRNALLSIGGRLYGREGFGRRLDGLSEAAAIRNTSGVVALELTGGPALNEVNEIREMVAERGLVLVAREEGKASELDEFVPGKIAE